MTSLRIRPPGDKSISHRLLMVAPLADGVSRLRGILDAADVRSTARVLRGLGAEIPDGWDGELRVAGPAPWRDAAETLDCGNSGTTARILTGLVAGLGRGAVLDGDASLRSRPMDRVVYPLQAMGARIRYLRHRDRLPLEVLGRASGSLRPLKHRARVASAQVKSALLLAGLCSGVRVEIVEPGRSRDHTERLLRAMGAPLEHGPEGSGARIVLGERKGDAPLDPLDLQVPADPSSAAFLVAAALLAGRRLVVEGISLNPTRTGFLEVLRGMGADVSTAERGRSAGEPVGDLEVRPSALRGVEIGPELVPRLLDEIPVLAVLAARAEGETRITGAGELRVKESDRLELLVTNLNELGGEASELPDGLAVRGPTERFRGRVRTGGDHRIAMAFGLLRAVPGSDVVVDDRECVDVSYPSFWSDLERIAA